MTNTHSGHSKFISLFKVLSGAVFGLIVPIVLIWSASQTVGQMLGDMNNDASQKAGHSEIVKLLQVYDIAPNNGNKFAFTSYLIAQQINEKVIKKKTLLKAVLMQLGLVIVSIGLLFIVLGFRDGGLKGGASGALGVDFNVTVGSTGLATIFLGVLMITFGGVVSNKFTTVGVPSFSHSNVATVEDQSLLISISKLQLLEEMKECREPEADYNFTCIGRMVNGLFKKE
jgi:hypothetical protein